MGTTQKGLKIYLPLDEVAQLEAISKSQGDRSITSIVREFVTAGLKSNGSSAPNPDEGKHARAATKGD